jgi:hypothetical protein
MEPSLRSSDYRPNNQILKRPEPAAHEATKRFVESLGSDIRISQYADLFFASKKFASDKWFWLEPFGHVGYLVYLPNQPAIWIDEQLRRSYKIPMRVSASVFEKKSVFITSLSTVDSILRIEDAWMIEGEVVRGKVFEERWEHIREFLTNSYIADSLLSKMNVQAAKYSPLAAAKTWHPVPLMMLAQGNTYPRRFRVQISQVKAPERKQEYHGETQALKRSQPHVIPAPVKKVFNPEQKPLFVDETPLTHAVPVQEKKHKIKEGKQKAIAKPHADFPDTYDLWINGVKKGYAAVQDIQMSRNLKKLSSKESLEVEIEWNSEFSMYEITNICS